ncbi:MAG: MoaD/ThiS family protein [Symploca sp. SIO2B6]|nr:MoaD/ThiS family protein [Symploca sp. SIO2B6]
MTVNVLIPTPLHKFTGGKASVECEAANITELMDVLDTEFPGIKNRLCDENGDLRRFINFYVDEEDIRFLNGEKTSLAEAKEVSIVPAVAGG